jgi:glycosyltransferase involved in cell wall biosynthesis
MNQLISIIVPTYHPDEYLTTCLDSLCQQSMAPTGYEIVIVLNGATAGFQESIETYINGHRDHSIRLVTTAERGVSNARNLGIEEARGTYLCFVDDDDWLSPNYLEQLMSQAEDDCIVASNVKMLDEKGRQLPHFLTEAFASLESRPYPHSQFAYRRFLSTACCKLIPRNVVANDRFDKRFFLGEDSLFMFVISKRIKGIRLTSKDVVYYVRFHEGSVSRSRYSYFLRAGILLRLSATYTRIWASDISHYSFPLYLSRVAATLKKLLLNHYE